MNTGTNNRRKYQISIIHSIYQITNKDPINNAQTSGTSCSMDWHEYTTCPKKQVLNGWEIMNLFGLMIFPRPIMIFSYHWCENINN